MITADLQIHSRYAQACSKQTNIENLEKYARIKGINLLSTADFTHPLWRKELDEKLTEDENGILWTKNKFPFLWGTEISLMYKQGGKGRRIHNLIFSPNKEVTDQITEALGKKGRLDYDGRPIFGFTSIELIDMVRGISNDIEIIPAHAWTPWFSIFGSKSGFDSIKECFQEKSKYIHAIETGLSSDPEMNWRLSQLDNINLVSFSDAHSFWPWRLGREATLFNTKLKYKEIINAIRTGEGLNSTIEVDPNYGKYHYTGHRNCNPICKKPLTIGVADRIEELADRPEGYKPKNARTFKKLIPLHEIIAYNYKLSQLTSKKVWETYNKLINQFESELNIMLNVEEEKLRKIIEDKLVDLIIKNRNQNLNIKPGYDGVYGEITEDKPQKFLNEF
ncbi:DNA helicase UvrD [Candidatus Woesearchaeota archaeon]|nr:DNA helicase UvrD [Candidatus Woesearchaeota archaeon]